MGEPKGNQRPADAPSRRRVGLLAAIGALVVVAGIVAAALLLPRDGDEGSEALAPVTTTISAPTPPVPPSPPSPTSSSSPEATPSSAASPVATPTRRVRPARPGAHRTAKPTRLRGTAEPAPSVTASLASIRGIDAKATNPNDIAGPGVEVVVSLENGTARKVDLTRTVVNLYYGPDRVPATSLDSRLRPFPAAVQPGRSTQGTFAFHVPGDDTVPVTVEVDLGSRYTVVLFRGPVAR